MPSVSAKRELGRGEKVLPGLWRLRLPLPFPGIPHCNAWAIQAGDGLVLVDCGIHEAASQDHPSSLSQLERAMAQVGLRLEQVHKLVITHAHVDHWGQAATVIQRSDCEMWMHPNYRHGTANDGAQALAHRLEIGRAAGVPERTLMTYAERAWDRPSGIAALVAPDHELVDGVTFDTDLGSWRVYETPGHAPSHVCFYQEQRRLLISGDHLLGRLSLYYDYGWTPDPIGEFLSSLDVVDALDTRLCMSGHGRTFTDARGHIQAAQKLVADRLAAATANLDGRPRTALELIPFIYGEQLTQQTAAWRLSETLCLLTHLQQTGLLIRESDGQRDTFRKA